MTESVEELVFQVVGVAAPQGSKSLWRGRMVEANPRTKLWRIAVQEAAEKALAGRDGFGKLPVSATAWVYLPRGKTVTRKYPSTKPDSDKLFRAIGDALTLAGVFHDDCQIVDQHAHKRYADDQPYVEIIVREKT